MTKPTTLRVQTLIIRKVMPKLIGFKINIETGKHGLQEPVKFGINGHELLLEGAQGGTGPGQVLEGGYSVNSFAHSLTIIGPEKGQWNIKKITVDYKSEGIEPYSVTFGEVTLDETTEVNIWNDPPTPSYDV